MYNLRVLFIVVSFFTLTACVPATAWRSSPPLQSGENSYFTAEFQPLKGEGGSYSLFRLRITNKTDKAIELLWKDTRYMENGKDRGTFVYRGIGSANVKNPQPEVIKAGETLTRDLCPAALVALAPLRDTNVQPGVSGINCGVIPAGEEGILITVRVDDGNVTEKLTVNIVEEKGR